MGLFKQFAQAMKPENIAKGLDAARNPPSQEEIEASLATLTPEQRAAYDANMAQVAAAQQQSRAEWEQAKAISDTARVLDGPAGRHLYGRTIGDDDSPDAIQARIQQGGVWAEVRRQRAESRGELTNALKQTFNRDAVPQEGDPARRAQIAAEAAGRERWAAYQRDVLQAHLERGTWIRRPLLVGDDSDLPAPIRAAARVADAFEWIHTIGVEDVTSHRYCWPPVDVA